MDFNLSDYPEDTDLVIAAIYTKTYKDQIERVSLKTIARVTNLTKDKVRYRVGQLIDDGFVNKWEPVNPDPSDPNMYWLTDDGVDFAETVGRAGEILGRYPDEPTKEDYIELVKHVRGMEARIDNLQHEIESIKSTMRF